MSSESSQSSLNDQNKTVLVTGGSGFIGSNLVKRLLEEANTVRVLVRPNSENVYRLSEMNVEIAEGDVTEPESLNNAMQGVTQVFHTAGVMNNDWDSTHFTNVDGTRNVLDAALQNNIERLLYLSDIEVYDVANARKGSLITEEWPLQSDQNQMGPYIHSRIEAEKLVTSAFTENGLKTTIVRASMVIGPMGRQLFFPQLGYQYKDKLFLMLRSGSNMLPLIYVENIADAMVRVIQEDKAIGQIYNLVDDPEITVKDYINKYIDYTGSRARAISIPYFLPYVATALYEIAASLGVVKKSSTSKSRFKWKHAPVIFDNTKAKNDLGLTPRVTLQKGMENTFESHMAQGRSKQD